VDTGLLRKEPSGAQLNGCFTLIYLAMDHSIFPGKNKIPMDEDLKITLGKTYESWQDIKNFVAAEYPGTIAEWNYPGEKYGWSFRIKDKKRAVLLLLPRDGYFKVAMVFGQKATDIILNSGISEGIKEELRSARVYAEGRGIRIEINNDSFLKDIYELIKIKQKN